MILRPSVSVGSMTRLVFLVFLPHLFVLIESSDLQRFVSDIYYYYLLFYYRTYYRILTVTTPLQQTYRTITVTFAVHQRMRSGAQEYIQQS